MDPLGAVRADIERYVPWLQDVRWYQPSRVCVIDQIMPYSSAD